jgi:hypothetical protein
LFGAGGQGGGDLVPGGAVAAGFGDELRKQALGLAGEAGDEAFPPGRAAATAAATSPARLSAGWMSPGTWHSRRRAAAEDGQFPAASVRMIKVQGRRPWL